MRLRVIGQSILRPFGDERKRRRRRMRDVGKPAVR